MAKLDNLLIIPGYGDPHDDRWQEYEAVYTRDQGLNVFYPQNIPGFQNGVPTVRGFRKVIQELLDEAKLTSENTIVLAHSMGGSGWIHLLKERGDLRACLAYLIGTPKDDHTGVAQVADFFPTPSIELSDKEKEQIIVVGSNNDPVINEDPEVLRRHLSVRSIMVPGAGHFMPRALSGDSDSMDLGSEWEEVREQIGLPY